MAKVKFNPTLTEVRGTVGNLIFRQTVHGAEINSKPTRPKRWSVKQKAHRTRLREAALFYRKQMADPTRRAYYEARARERHIPVSAYVMGGYMKYGTNFAENDPGRNAANDVDGRDGADVD